MADDSQEVIEPIDFHPCDTPRGMLYYDVNALTPEQQHELNYLKTDTVREDERYLAANPEVRAIIVLVLRYVFKHRPRSHLHKFIANFFLRPPDDIEDDVKDYILTRVSHKTEGDSALFKDIMYEKRIRKIEKQNRIVETEDKQVQAKETKFPDDILDDLVDSVFAKIDEKEGKEPKSESALFSETKDKQLGLRESNIPEEILNDLIVSVFSKLESYIKEQESEQEIMSDVSFIRNIVHAEVWDKMFNTAVDIRELIEDLILKHAMESVTDMFQDALGNNGDEPVVNNEETQRLSLIDENTKSGNNENDNGELELPFNLE